MRLRPAKLFNVCPTKLVKIRKSPQTYFVEDWQRRVNGTKQKSKKSL